jgi:Domain of unknown function (DUF6089)
MTKYIITVLCLCSAIFLTTTATAQMRGWEVGAWGGVSNYFGDLNTEWRLNRVQLSGGLGTRYNFNDRLCIKMGANYGRISAADAESSNSFEQRRNLSFESNILEGTMQLEFNFLPYVHGSRDYFFTPYMFTGPAFYYFNPQTELNGVRYDLVEMGTEGQFNGDEYNLAQLGWSYGLGLKMDLSYRWSLSLELSARKLFTDYIDDVSGVYAEPKDIRAQRGPIAVQLADRSGEPKIGEEGRQRGNGLSNDVYSFLHVGVMYYFGQVRCPALQR